MAVSKSSCVVVFVTAADEHSAASIGRTLVEERLAACANLVGPIRSIYRWQGAIEDVREHLIVIKTRAALFERLRARVQQLHPYEVPEIVAVPIEQGSAPYLAWVRESTAPPPASASRARKPAPERSGR